MIGRLRAWWNRITGRGVAEHEPRYGFFSLNEPFTQHATSPFDDMSEEEVAEFVVEHDRQVDAMTSLLLDPKKT